MNQRYFVLLFMAWFCGLALAIAHIDDRKVQGTSAVMPTTTLNAVHDRGDLVDDCTSYPGHQKTSHREEAPAHDRDLLRPRARAC
ncbi:hypothetical protein EC912_102426 [Luteibacter rhizovicinus]|uniref:Uncharacterized protein n=1 Tax=Luteibacter rhizovicinus TaxID=242606 RepID=A0A4R3YT31_9GAMM|nr:hypothetical protein [Luteibacter rhizovicinus]TCV96077.1 hypothetical protein EC912_102426 [Luteibacter rhizovicinus]